MGGEGAFSFKLSLKFVFDARSIILALVMRCESRSSDIKPFLKCGYLMHLYFFGDKYITLNKKMSVVYNWF